MAQSQQVCTFFQFGNCRLGATCPYLHQMTSNTQLPPHAVMPPCFYYQQGNCRFGETCFYRHERDTNAVVQQPCWYLVENGWCTKGMECRFSHDLNAVDWEKANMNKAFQDSQQQQEGQQPQLNFYQPPAIPEPKKASSRRVENAATKCVYYAKGHCMRGDKCCYVHEDPESVARDLGLMTVDEYLQALKKSPNPVKSTCKKETTNEFGVTGKPQELESKPLSLCSVEELSQYRRQEETNIIRRMTREKMQIVEEEDGTTRYCMDFQPTDPDWEFSISEIPLAVVLPRGYPREQLGAFVRQSDRLPETIVKHMNEAISEWLESYHRDLVAEDCVQLYFRKLLQWFDRNVGGLFYEGFERHQEECRKRQTNEVPDRVSDEGEDFGTGIISAAGGVSVCPPGVDSAASCAPPQPTLSQQPIRRGTEVALRGLQMRDSLSSAWFPRLSVAMRCARCKTQQPWLGLEHGRVARMAHCTKCGVVQMAAWRAALLHTGSVEGCIAGFLDVEGLHPVDIIFPDSMAALRCGACDAEFQKDNLERQTGNEPRCTQCHSKGYIYFEGVRITQITAADWSSTKLGGEDGLQKPKKKSTKSPFIREGQPLPGEGTCKHYRHSYRWFRFPCCGLAFPCDLCHNESVEDGHEATFASKIICGFCATEQRSSLDKPCVSCRKMLIRHASAHWEGGKGCRDKMKMSKNDPKKYINCNKTAPSNKKAANPQKKT